ncbi:MFS transporter [Bordetella genomosp. 8]|uniref:MFS transporter n=1 Tax=Bordetella genomosp. 8 TaxID=1416806 RepID=UPI0012FDA6E2|nr:MFS transporter [Bordetella genomosp. 8]
MPTPPSHRPLALVVGAAFFMEQMDTTIITTSLPQMARDLGVDPLQMNLAITAYLISLVVFIPASGTLADRYGARTVFRTAMALFALSSIACGLSGSLGALVAARVLQGASSAMMVPVGRLIMLRSVEKKQLVDAMAWVLMPGMVGPLLGPPLGGFITTYSSWHWIFFINVPVAALGVLLAGRYVPHIARQADARLDIAGLVLSGVALSAVIHGMDRFSNGLAGGTETAGWLAAGVLAGVAYARHARRMARPSLDFSLLRLQSFGVAFNAGFLVRAGFGALPFLVPLMLQTTLGMNPLQSGMAMLAGAIAAVFVKAASVAVLRRAGFRNVLIYNSLICGASIALCAAFDASWPIAAISGVLLVGGMARALQFNAFGTFAYADVPKDRMSAATSLYSTMQQLAATVGIAVSVWVLQAATALRGHEQPVRQDYALAFLLIGVLTAAAAWICVRLPDRAGAELSGHGSRDARRATARS